MSRFPFDTSLLDESKSELDYLRQQRDTLHAQILTMESRSAPSTNSYNHMHSHEQYQSKTSEVPRSMSDYEGNYNIHDLETDHLRVTATASTFLGYPKPPTQRTISQDERRMQFGTRFTEQISDFSILPSSSSFPLKSGIDEISDCHENEANFGSYGLYNSSQVSRPHFQMPCQSAMQCHGLKDLADPGDFLAQSGMPKLQISYIPPTLQSSCSDSTDPSYGSWGDVSSSLSAVPMTHSLTLESTTMSSSPSLFDGGFEMLRLQSNTTYNDTSNENHIEDQSGTSSSLSTHQFSKDEQAQMLTGAGGIGFGQYTDLVVSQDFEVAMKKSDSTQSSSSVASRSRQRLQTQNQQAESRTIKPKYDVVQPVSKESSFQERSEIRTAVNHGQVKSTAARKKEERVACLKCLDKPEFRGAHELRRHQERAHETWVKRWIVVEPKDGGREQPVKPLSSCKACGQQRKQYGAYYNVAAHLRRAHFVPKLSKKLKGTKVKQEKRGGMGGGDWPDMKELKKWMKVIIVEVPPPHIQQPSADGRSSSSNQYEQKSRGFEDGEEVRVKKEDDNDLLVPYANDDHLHDGSTDFDMQNTTVTEDYSQHSVDYEEHLSYPQQVHSDVFAPFEDSFLQQDNESMLSDGAYTHSFNM